MRIKGLEPPRLSASDPKSDVATNYTISAALGDANIQLNFDFANSKRVLGRAAKLLAVVLRAEGLDVESYDGAKAEAVA